MLLRSTICICLIWLSGCAQQTRPDLTRLYSSSQSSVDQPPVILIHGVMGAMLSDQRTGQEVWIGSLPKFLTSRYQELALPIDPATLEPTSTALVLITSFFMIGGRTIRRQRFN